MNSTITDLKVQVTTDYDKFSYIEGNRKINKSNYKKLVMSMKEEQLIIPIIVNEKYEIIDGQHRFYSARDLGKPIYYIMISGYGISQVKRANTVGINWSNDDFLQTYLAENNENYIAISDLKKDSGLGVNSILKIVAQFQNKSHSIIVDKFQNGELDVDIHGSFGGVRRFCEQLDMFSIYKDYKASGFVNAFLKLYLHDDYDSATMEKQAKWMINFQPKGKNSESILEELCKNVYSFRLSNGKIYYNRELQRFFR